MSVEVMGDGAPTPHVGAVAAAVVGAVAAAVVAAVAAAAAAARGARRVISCTCASEATFAAHVACNACVPATAGAVAADTVSTVAVPPS